MKDVLVISLGVLPGAWLRYRVVNHLEPVLPRKHWGTFAVNVAACFGLGLLFALQERNGAGAQATLLLLGTGFFGGFSTFSSFAAEIYVLLRRADWLEATLLTSGSVLAALVAMQLGLAIGAMP